MLVSRLKTRLCRKSKHKLYNASRSYCLCIHLCRYVSMSSYNIPLVADIHFAPTIALRVAECFDKIRVNPGNFGMHFFANSVVFLYSLLMLSCILNQKCCLSQPTDELSLKYWSTPKTTIRKNLSILNRSNHMSRLCFPLMFRQVYFLLSNIC